MALPVVLLIKNWFLHLKFSFSKLQLLCVKGIMTSFTTLPKYWAKKSVLLTKVLLFLIPRIAHYNLQSMSMANILPSLMFFSLFITNLQVLLGQVSWLLESKKITRNHIRVVRGCESTIPFLAYQVCW